MANEVSKDVSQSPAVGGGTGGFGGGAQPRDGMVTLQSEKAQIENIMKTDRQRYNRDVEMQNRYLAILTAEEGDSAPSASSEPSLVPMPSAKEWQANGNDPSDLAGFHALARQVNDILSAGDGAALGTSFDRLPQNVQARAFGVLLDRSPVAPTFFTGDQVNNIMKDPAMQPLAQEWGADAPRRVGFCDARLSQILTPLSDAEYAAARSWLGSLSTPVSTALIRSLAR